jgi:hypothetical protein
MHASNFFIAHKMSFFPLTIVFKETKQQDDGSL